jgi:hypothetical protein
MMPSGFIREVSFLDAPVFDGYLQFYIHKIQLDKSYGILYTVVTVLFESFVGLSMLASSLMP